MASWKFSLDFDWIVSNGLRYCLAMSQVRPRLAPDLIGPLTRFDLAGRFGVETTEAPFSWRAERKRYFRARDGVEKLVPVFDSILQSQSVEDWEQLPPYGQESWGVAEPDLRLEKGKGLRGDPAEACPEVRSRRRPDLVWT